MGWWKTFELFFRCIAPFKKECRWVIHLSAQQCEHTCMTCSEFLYVVFQAVCCEVDQSERVREKIQEEVNKLKEEIALRKRNAAEEERSMCWSLCMSVIASEQTNKSFWYLSFCVCRTPRGKRRIRHTSWRLGHARPLALISDTSRALIHSLGGAQFRETCKLLISTTLQHHAASGLTKRYTAASTTSCGLARPPFPRPGQRRRLEFGFSEPSGHRTGRPWRRWRGQ